MSATAWTFYTTAKKKIGAGDIVLDTDSFRMSLHSAASNASTVGLSIQSQVTTEIAAAGGYALGGKSIAGIEWTISGAAVKWDATDLIFTASAANLSIIKFAVIHKSVTAVTSGPLLCWSRLSASEFSVTTNNTLTIQFATAGIFTLT